jgi:anaerobic ribonucleoside-triphosphate reductase activating protein
MIWHLNKIQYPVYNLGPGKRLGIWVQGCSIHCKGCINKSTWNKKNGKKLPVINVYEIVNQLCQDYDGITITGGEPFDQYPQLMAFATMLKRKTNLNILCYTGFNLEELETKFPDKVFYKCIDFLIDGRFEKDNPSSNSIKGSENQAIYSFADGYPVKTDLRNIAKTWSIKCENEMVYMAGIPGDEEMDKMIKNLYESGLNANMA